MREIYIASGKYISATTIQFPAREIHLQHTKLPPQYSALQNMSNLYCCTACPEISTLENLPTICCMDSSIRPCCSKKNPPKQARKSCQTFLVQTARIRTVWSPTAAITISTHTKIFSWELCPNSLGKCAFLAALTFLSQVISEISLNLLLNVFCTLPNAFSYNLKVTLHLLQP
jgi:hypothetical protein